MIRWARVPGPFLEKENGIMISIRPVSRDTEVEE